MCILKALLVHLQPNPWLQDVLCWAPGYHIGSRWSSNTGRAFAQGQHHCISPSCHLLVHVLTRHWSEPPWTKHGALDIFQKWTRESTETHGDAHLCHWLTCVSPCTWYILSPCIFLSPTPLPVSLLLSNNSSIHAQSGAGGCMRFNLSVYAASLDKKLHHYNLPEL